MLSLIGQNLSSLCQKILSSILNSENQNTIFENMDEVSENMQNFFLSFLKKLHKLIGKFKKIEDVLDDFKSARSFSTSAPLGLCKAQPIASIDDIIALLSQL